jgi:hypothetical protein
MTQNNKREINLTEVQRQTLEAMRDYHQKPYLREKAAAILKIEAGHSVRWVAQKGLLKQRNWKTVVGWLNDYVDNGLGSLYIASGRGRKPAYEP